MTIFLVLAVIYEKHATSRAKLAVGWGRLSFINVLFHANKADVSAVVN